MLLYPGEVRLLLFPSVRLHQPLWVYSDLGYFCRWPKPNQTGAALCPSAVKTRLVSDISWILAPWSAPHPLSDLEHCVGSAALSQQASLAGLCRLSWANACQCNGLTGSSGGTKSALQHFCNTSRLTQVTECSLNVSLTVEQTALPKVNIILLPPPLCQEEVLPC